MTLTAKISVVLGESHPGGWRLRYFCPPVESRDQKIPTDRSPTSIKNGVSNFIIIFFKGQSAAVFGRPQSHLELNRYHLVVTRLSPRPSSAERRGRARCRELPAISRRAFACSIAHEESCSAACVVFSTQTFRVTDNNVSRTHTASTDPPPVQIHHNYFARK